MIGAKNLHHLQRGASNSSHNAIQYSLRVILVDVFRLKKPEKKTHKS